MVKKIIKYKLTNPQLFKCQIIEYIRKFDTFCFLDSNSLENDNSTFDYLVAFSKSKEINEVDNSFSSLNKLIYNNQDWVFGCLTYDLKNNIEHLSSCNNDFHHFPLLHFLGFH